MAKLLIYAILVLGAFALLKIILQKLFGEKKNVYSYRAKECFMTAAEKDFFEALKAAVGEKYQIFAQVHLATILEHKVDGQNWHGAFRHIDEKSVDFVLCDPVKLKPLLAIELDDRSHDEPKRQLRDEEVDRIFDEAGLSLLRFKNQSQYDQLEIIQRVDEKLNVTRLA